MTAKAATIIAQVIARAIAPRKPLTVSAWADAEMVLSSKGSAEPGRWRTSRNPPLREPMDCLSARSTVREVVAAASALIPRNAIRTTCHLLEL